MNDVSQKLAQINDLAVALGNYYKAHSTSENEILVRVSLLLLACNLALDYLVRATTYGESEIKKLIGFLEPAYPQEAEKLRGIIPQVALVLPLDRIKLKQDYTRRLMSDLNAASDLGRQLLRVRELKDQGASEQDVKRFIDSWKVENIF